MHILYSIWLSWVPEIKTAVFFHSQRLTSRARGERRLGTHDVGAPHLYGIDRLTQCRVGCGSHRVEHMVCI